MTRTKRTHDTTQLFIWLALLLVAFFMLGIFDASERLAFDSHEVRFTDASKSGLSIMPASCASNAAQWHSNLTEQGAGYSLAPTCSGDGCEYGAYKHGIYLCVTNSSGSTYFIPANSAAEMNSFYNTSIPGVSKWKM